MPKNYAAFVNTFKLTKDTGTSAFKILIYAFDTKNVFKVPGCRQSYCMRAMFFANLLN